jgi:hypothetical protein
VALLFGKNLILTPGVYNLDRSIVVPYPDTVVLGIGFPTLIPQNGNPSMIVISSKGDLLSGMIFDAGPTKSPVLLEAGTFLSLIFDDHAAADPSAIQDVFFRIGGAEARRRAWWSTAATPFSTTFGRGARTTATELAGLPTSATRVS